MGANCRHDRSTDRIPYYNLTNNTSGGCSIANSQVLAKTQVGKGFEMLGCTLAIKIGGQCDINQKDKIKVLGKIYIAETVQTTLAEPKQARLNADCNCYTGDTIVGLK